MSFLSFDLQLRECRACLGVPGCEAAASSAAKQALALEPYLPVLAALEGWLGQPWQRIAPTALDEHGDWPAAELALSVQLQPAAGGAAAQLALPWACWPIQATQATQTIPPRWPVLPGFTVQWPVAAVQWVLDHIAEGLLPTQPPAVGDLVLLPSTFAADNAVVSVRARVLAGPAASWPELGGATWDTQQGAIDLRRAAPCASLSAADDNGAWQICTAPSPQLQLPLGCWWGAVAPPQNLLPLPAQNLPVQLRRGPQGAVQAAGSLVCLGRGWALRVEPAQHQDNEIANVGAPRRAA